MVNPKPLDGYVRVSVVGGRAGESFQSPAAQRDAIHKWAEYRGREIGEVFEDLDRSGGTLKREGLQAILARIEAGESGGIVVAKLDRLSRSVADGLRVVDEIQRAGGEIVCTDQAIDTTSPGGKFQLTLWLAIAEWYRDSVTEQWAQTKARAIERKAWPGRTPYGTRRLESGRVELHPITSQHVARMVTERAAGRGWKAIATGLRKDEIPTPTSDSDSPSFNWAASTVQAIVSSEACRALRRPGARRRENPDPGRVGADGRAFGVGRRAGDQRQARRLPPLPRSTACRDCAVCRLSADHEANHQPAGARQLRLHQPRAPRPIKYWRRCAGRVRTVLIDQRLERLTLEASERTDDDYEAVKAAADDASREFEIWRDDGAMRAAIGDADYRAGSRRTSADP